MNLISLLGETFYCIVVMMAATVAALIVSIKYYGRHRNLRMFTYYIAFSLLEDVVGLGSVLAPTIRSAMIIEAIAVNSFSLFEFVIVNLFILHYIKSPIRRRIIKINAFALLLLLTFIVVKTYPLSVYAPYFMLNGIFLVLPCLVYFYELFQRVNLRPLLDQPAFWIVTAFLFHAADTIPYGLTLFYLGKKNQIAAFSVIYILYTVLFLLIIKAILCPPENSAADNRVNELDDPPIPG